MKSRKLKLSNFRVKSTWSERFYPVLRLQGKWLHDLGFCSGDTVEVRHDQDVIIITKISGEAEVSSAEEQLTRNSR